MVTILRQRRRSGLVTHAAGFITRPSGLRARVALERALRPAFFDHPGGTRMSDADRDDDGSEQGRCDGLELGRSPRISS